jgi:hypothetical protein
MEETAEHQRQMLFHLTGAFDGHLEPVDSAVRPALLARYSELASLRYDFPVVLVDDSANGAFVCSLTSVVDDVLQEVAPRGAEGERVRRQVLHAESEIRKLVAEGARGLLTELWQRAAPNLADVGARLKVDGELADCDHDLPRRLIEHAWQSVQRGKADGFHAEVNRLVQALSDILRAAFIHSEAGHRPESLRAAFGSPHHEQFDFETMARVLGSREPRDEIPADRRERIESALAVLRRQRFFPGTESPFEYGYDSCADAAGAFRQRLPELVEFVKAMSIADLEADGRYVPSEHNAIFERFAEESLTDEDLALFPDYLVRVDDHEHAAVMELLSSGLPVKVLVDTGELLDAGKFGVGMRNTQLASTALGLIDVFTLQTTSSNVYQMREPLLAGLQYAGPTLVSVFSGAATPASDLPPYLTSAAALEGRAFPAFTYDPTAGPDLAARFSVDANPQPELDWPLAQLEYADASLQRVVEQVAFTLVDFAVCDARCARHFTRIPREHWTDTTIPVDEWLSLDPAEASARVPHILVIDEQDSLQRLIVDAKLMQAARRCREVWRGLRELSLVHLRTPAALLDEPPTEAVEEPAAEPPPSEEEVVEERVADDPWIETPRCSTCNECTTINDRLFAYNDNKQAYIMDPDAGTFRELVEAAESCQVAIIHPGKPRNPNETGLEELVERAKPFQ